MTIYSADILGPRLHYLRAGGTGYAFFVGSGLTAPTIPGVGEALRWMEEGLQGSPEAEAQFKAATQEKRGGLAYQAGAEALIGLRGQKALDDTVRAMVLKSAHKPTKAKLDSGEMPMPDFDDAYCAAAERAVDDWMLNPAVERFAELLVQGSGSDRPLVVTTNFDPLIQIAVRKAGGAVVTEAFDADGSLGSIDPGDAVVVAHLHGFWRQNDTAHVPEQLLRDRPGLQASLEDLLRERTVVVSGYGGWDDVFTSALIDAVRRHRAGDLDVLWTFLSENPEELSTRHQGLFDSVGYVPGRVTFYMGVDCESLFKTMAAPDEGDGAAGDVSGEKWFRSPEEGFTAVSEDLLAAQGDLSQPDLVRFFDGQVPNWQVALADEVPRLGGAERAIAQLSDRSSELSVLLLDGPAGEGKSTALRQMAAHFATRDGWRVLWREGGLDSRLDPSSLEQGPWRWLLVIDDADAVVEDCLRAVRELHEHSRTDIHLLLAARTSDWRAQRGSKQPWSAYASFDTVRVEGLSESDARAVVDSWSTAGEAGLGNLRAESSPARRADALLSAAKDEAVRNEGSFFGAMLKVRFGEGLRDHVRTLGNRLAEVQVGSGATLLEAFLYVSCVHARGVVSLCPEALAAALGIPREQIHRQVIFPLGDEAALTAAGSYVRVRHRSIAEAAVDLASEWGEDIAEIYHGIIAGTVRAYREGVYIPNLADIVYLPRKLPDSIALRAARAPVEEEPERLGYRTSLARIMRKAGHADEGMEVAHRAYVELDSMIDRWGARALLHEWAVCASVAGKTVLSAYLALLDVSDEPVRKSRPVDIDQLKMSLTGLPASLAKLSKQTDAEWLKDGQAAITAIQLGLGSNIKVSGLAQHMAACEAMAEQLSAWAARESADELPLPPGPPTFNQILGLVSPDESSSRG